MKDRLIPIGRGGFGRFGKPLVLNNMKYPTTLVDFQLILNTFFGGQFGVPANEIAFLAMRLWQIATSCDERRLAEYEQVSWWDFIQAGSKSAQYQSLFGMVTHSFVAADPKRVSARTMGSMAIQSLLGTMTPGGQFQSVLDGPTSDVFIKPWVDLLTASGVSFMTGAEVTQIHCAGGAITGISVSSQNAPLTADEYISALPVEVLASLLDTSLLAADPALANLKTLAASHVAWMNGLQFYLQQKIDMIPGHILYLDTPWALTAISQAQFWPRVDLSKIGGWRSGAASRSMSRTGSRRGFTTKNASVATRAELINEVWTWLQNLEDGSGTSTSRD